jgi:4-amino-4-deoxy-L-arabinose transferase-like glycosyltransferase
VGVGYGAYVVVTRRLTRRLVLLACVVLALAALVAAPWYIAMNAREPGYLRYYFLNRHLLGFATETQRHGGQPWWYYLPLVLAGGLPWVVFVRPRAASDAPAKLLWTWLAASLVLLSVSNSKAVTYMLPVMPAIAILASRSTSLLRHWRSVAGVSAVVYAAALVSAGLAVARGHSAIDLSNHFNNAGGLPNRLFVMEHRVSFAYYLRPEIRARIREDQIETVTLDQLAVMQPFPSDAVLALPADLADARLARLPQLVNAHRTRVGRYLLISP